MKKYKDGLHIWHNANIFDVFFKGKENVCDKDIVAIIEDVAKFFNHTGR